MASSLQDLESIRREIVIALFTDNDLLDRLVLKGGNALALLYKVGGRASLDLDFSVATDLEDLNVADLLSKALVSRFAPKGLIVFDTQFDKVPPGHLGKFSGYNFKFKLFPKAKSAEIESKYHGDPGAILEAMRRDAVTAGPNFVRIFSIQISKHEYCEPKAECSLDHYIVYAYTPEMIAVEKIRAICQQNPAYIHRAHHSPRARDFYDIHCLLTERNIDLASERTRSLFEPIFAAKDVPLRLIAAIRSQREFHRRDWPSVVDAVGTGIQSFDFYFESVVARLDQLKAVWEVDAP